jgi:hypothetical protein
VSVYRLVVPHSAAVNELRDRYDRHLFSRTAQFA